MRFHYILEKHWGNPASEHRDAAAQPWAPACFAGSIATLQCCYSCVQWRRLRRAVEGTESLGLYLVGNKLVKMLLSVVSAAN